VRFSPLVARERLVPWARGFWGAVVLLALSACFGSGDDGPSGRRDLRLERSAEGAVLAKTALMRLIPDDGEIWRTSASAQIKALPALGIDRCLYFKEGPVERSVSLHGSFSATGFNQISVGYLCRNRSTLVVSLLRDGREILVAERQLVRVSSEPQIITASFLGHGEEREPYDEILIRFPDRAGPVGFLFVELQHVSAEAWMESQLVRGSHARVGNQLRPARWLTPGHTLKGTYKAGVDDRLVYSVAIEEQLGSIPVNAAIEVSLIGGGPGERLHRYTLSETPLGWNDLSMWGQGEEGAEIEFAVNLVDCDDGAVGIWVTDPIFDLRRDEVEVAPALAPLVLLITSATHRADHLAAALGSVKVKTPALDALAARGVLFERAQATSCITLPSHTAMLTGVHPRDLGIVDNVTPLEDQARTLQEVFQEEGWMTFAAVSALHLGHEVSGLSQGFDRVTAPAFGTVSGEASVQQILGWLNDGNLDRPVFAWLHVYDPHAPYTATEFEGEYLKEARAEDSELPLSLREGRARYRGEVSYVDHQLRALLEHPRVRAGVVAFTADHGEVLGQHGINFTHTEVYPDTVRVPLVMTWPGCPAGTRVERPVSNHDIGKSLLSAAGLGRRDFPGVDLLMHLDGRGAPEAAPLFAFSWGGEAVSMTWRDRHIILHLKGHAIGQPAPLWVSKDCQVEFYDLSVDPGCVNDLVEERHEEAADYRRLLINWLLAAEDRGWAGGKELSEEVLSQLADLGYTGPSDADGDGWWSPDPEAEWFKRFEDD
jgi:arylsulfatase A-like enzyme